VTKHKRANFPHSLQTKQVLEKIFRAGVNAVDPEASVYSHLRREGDILHAQNKLYSIKNYNKITLVGAGKGAAPMARAVEKILKDDLSEGIIVVKYEHGLPLSKTEVMEAGHPLPDANGHQAALKIISTLQPLTKDDLVIVVFSGGGSALLPAPAHRLSLADKQQTTRRLLECGATINELNAIRKHLSRVKGGRLAQAAYPATMISLILSDVIGDPLDVIASGPTTGDESTFNDCLDIINRYEIRRQLPETVVEIINSGADGKIEETPKPGSVVFKNVQNIIVGGNRSALEAAKQQAESLGFSTLLLTSQLQGEAREVAQVIAAVGKEITTTQTPLQPPACILAGGETTVTLKGKGKGGRNQEFALAAALAIDGWKKISILSAGTDGSDGPTDATGAFADGMTMEFARQMKMVPEAYLDNNDAYHFFDKLDDLLKTGPTRTNVMDLVIMIVAP
jgi:hydroxypyruvate reductase